MSERKASHPWNNNAIQALAPQPGCQDPEIDTHLPKATDSL